jgi:hypothetical protein
VTANERAGRLAVARGMSVADLHDAIGFYADAEADGSDEDYCQEHRAVYEQALSERVGDQ